MNTVDGTSRRFDITLPVATHGHNVLKINETHVALINVGATVDPLVVDNAWIMDTVRKSWIALPRMGVARYQAVAGIVTHLDGKQEIVVAAGANAVSFTFAILIFLVI